MPRPADGAMRKDAVLNRERLLAAASELFAERGIDVTLNDIAHHAGLGVGTAYRRFPNKEAIIDALFEQRLERVAELAREALDDPDAWHGLTVYLESALHMRFGDRGLSQVMNNRALGDDRVREVRDRIAPITIALVEKAKRQGVVRPDLDQADLIFLQVALSAIIETSRDIAPELYRRYLAIFLDGIRSDRSKLSRLPEPLSVDETHLVMTHDRRAPRGADRPLRPSPQNGR